MHATRVLYAADSFYRLRSVRAARRLVTVLGPSMGNSGYMYTIHLENGGTLKPGAITHVFKYDVA